MTDDIGSLLARRAILFALLFGTFISIAAAQQAEGDRQNKPISDAAESASHPMMQPLTEFEKMELHHQRYSAAANNIAHLFKQLSQKIQEVSLAAKTVEAKDNSHNRRQLETKLQQLENARAAYNVQYSQLQSQMQNEYRHYAAISNNLKARYDAAATRKQEGNREEADKNADGTTRSAGDKPAKAKSAKDRDTASRNAKAKESWIEEQDIEDSPARDPRILDLDTKEVRARREGRSTIEPSENPLPVPEPTSNIVR